MYQTTIMTTKLFYNLPDFVQHIILEFLDFKLRNGKYIRRIPVDLPVYSLLQNRPKTREIFFTATDSPVRVNRHYDEENDIYYFTDDNENLSFFETSILIKEYCTGRGHLSESFQDRLEINYCYNDRNAYTIQKSKYIESHPDFWVRLHTFDTYLFNFMQPVNIWL